jgi:hypothetical protein
VTNKVISEEELTLLLSSGYHNEEKEQVEKPKLTMKYLYELIRKLQNENLILTHRINELEQSLDLFHRTRAEVAATAELPVLIEPEMTAVIEAADLKAAPPIATLIPRSERHSVQKKKSIWSFWTFWFRFKKRESLI